MPPFSASWPPRPPQPIGTPTMSEESLRRRVAWEAARILFGHEETELFRAKRKAAQRIYGPRFRRSDLPTNREVQMELQRLIQLQESGQYAEKLRLRRLEALRWMRLLEPFQPRLFGSTLTGEPTLEPTILFRLFSDSPESIRRVLETEGANYRMEAIAPADRKLFGPTHRIWLRAAFPIRMRVYPYRQHRRVFRCRGTGQVLPQVSLPEFEELILRWYPQLWVRQIRSEAQRPPDRFQVYYMLLAALEEVREDPWKHPEGDVLYHSLQVFELARQARPYDEEFQLAALLHDVGKAIDPKDHVAAALKALDGFITERTAWFIQHHVEALAFRDGTLGARARRRLMASEDFEELMLLAQFDRQSCRQGVRTVDLEEALQSLRDLARLCGE
ncbi:MAG: HD domain-containing protein [Thermoguttaceae bacterium]|nr:HD domain-containing protein [Thermoguttaceae bacterium]MDW8038031.1 HD domain-containing protein [Thermoguttaceae bacterium]